jgi:hypothetical protein
MFDNQDVEEEEQDLQEVEMVSCAIFSRLLNL